MNYVYDDMAGHVELLGLDKDFAPFYVFTVIRKFIFFVDAARRGRMNVRELAHSSLLHEWEQRKTLSHTQSVSTDSSSMDTLRQALALAASSASAAGLLSIGATTLSSNLFSCTDPGRLNTNASASSSAATRPSWFSLQSSQGIYALYLSLRPRPERYVIAGRAGSLPVGRVHWSSCSTHCSAACLCIRQPRTAVCWRWTIRRSWTSCWLWSTVIRRLH